MSGLIEFLTTEEMILVYVLVGIASVLYFIIYILDKTAMKRKQMCIRDRHLSDYINTQEENQNYVKFNGKKVKNSPEAFMSVSYTHLDVYKRQVRDLLVVLKHIHLLLKIEQEILIRVRQMFILM